MQKKQKKELEETYEVVSKPSPNCSGLDRQTQQTRQKWARSERVNPTSAVRGVFVIIKSESYYIYKETKKREREQRNACRSCGLDAVHRQQWAPAPGNAARGGGNAQADKKRGKQRGGRQSGSSM